MIKNMARSLAALTLALTPLALPTSVPAAPGGAQAFPLSYAVDQIPVEDESRTGYTRDKFRHWNSGLDPVDGCSTRNEVFLDEAAEAPVAELLRRAGGHRPWQGGCRPLRAPPAATSASGWPPSSAGV
ncbi:hypothetical protein ACFXHD_00400 [Streptomyces hydrogenans]|uniref:hypothetical protein n=1 Tax=Streptomyces hydrogenans TaxID=1873719 RepID=UPI0036B96350